MNFLLGTLTFSKKRSWRSSLGKSSFAAARTVDELRLKTELAFDFWNPDSAETPVLLNHPRLRRWFQTIPFMSAKVAVKLPRPFL